MLDWIFEGIITWISSIASSLMDAVSGLFLNALGADMTVMEEYFPFITVAYTVMQYMAWAILFLITVWQLFRTFGGPITEAEHPLHLIARSSIFALLISALNMRLSTEVIGIEPAAMQMLQTYNWPYNYDQLKRIISELVSAAKTPYIDAESVSKLLRRELPIQSASLSLDLNRTLEEINFDIAQQILAEEHGNQSSTAKRLGISRTTLWRMLQRGTSSSNGSH